MKAGTVVRLPDGRVGTVVYHGLDGYGVKWGRHALTIETIEAAMNGASALFGTAPPDYPYHPDALIAGDYEIVLTKGEQS